MISKYWALAVLFTTATSARAEIPFKDGFPVTDRKQVFETKDLTRSLKGVGYTVFAGHEVETFGVEVLGLIEGMLGPGRHIILVRLSGANIEKTGVIAGMSGSPVFIGDKLLGAVSYRFGNFTAEPIAGITPIESMLEIYGDSVDSPKKGQRRVSVESLRSRDVEIPVPHPVSSNDGRSMQRIETPLFVGGMSDTALRKLSNALTATGIVAVSGGSGSKDTRSARERGATYPNELSEAGLVKAAPIAPGAPVAAVLISGDMYAAATGTVTFVDGPLVLAFGHPFFGYGRVRFPMATASILNTLASQAGSYKQAATSIEVGVIDDDRITAIGGRLGVVAPTVPVHISVRPEGRDRTIDTQVEIVDDDTWTPILLRSVIESAASGRLSQEMGGTIDMQAKIRVSGRTIELSDTYVAPPPNDVAEQVSSDLSRIVMVLGQNSIERGRFEGIDVSIESRGAPESAWIQEVVPDKTTVLPGEKIGLTAKLRSYRGPILTERLEVTVPTDADGPMELYVGGSIELDRRDARVYGDRNPTGLDDIIHILEERRSGRGIYARIYFSRKGIRTNADVLTSLPVSKRVQLDVPTGVVHREVTEAFGPSAAKKTSVFVSGAYSVTLRAVNG